jgi:4'-phosphopantetheinyl transferase EntD
MKLDGKRLTALFPAAVVAEEAHPALLVDELYPEERAQIARAVDKRRAEYATVRVLARKAIRRLGVAAAPIVNGEDRSPAWPDGVVGSITHTKGYCGVVAAKASDVRSLGADVEGAAAARTEIWKHICTETEHAWIVELAEADRGQVVKRFFSAKEAFYKAQYPLTRQYLGFHDVEMQLDLEGGRFEVQLQRDSGEFATGARFEGRTVVGDGLVISALTIV